MLNEKMIEALDVIALSLTDVEEIESCSFMRCDCTGGCTDSCFDCSDKSGNQY